jgi:tetratricopeptide (TPR) repeat protein
MAAGAAVLVAIAVAGFLFLRSRKAQALTEKDSVLLTDFVNTTGDPVFDGTLKEALAVQLAQSPYFNIFPQERVRETLRYMGRLPEERITPDLARQICQREGVKAVLNGSITSIGSEYVLGVDAVNCKTGDTLAREQVEVAKKEQVIGGVGKAASSLRGKLGESLPSVQKFDAPAEEATTSSLEALKAFSMGESERGKGNERGSIPFYKHAIELDPNFAIAHARLGQVYSNLGDEVRGIELTKQAFELRDRASELEKLYISSHYYAIVTGELDKEIETYQLWKQTYPRDSIPTNNLSVAFSQTGKLEESLQEAMETVRLAPEEALGYVCLSSAYMQLNRFAEAKTVIERAEKLKRESVANHLSLYEMGVLDGDAASTQRQVEWAKGKLAEFRIREDVANAAAYRGKLQKARELYREAVTMAEQANFHGPAALLKAKEAWMEALAGNLSAAGAGATGAMATDRSVSTLRIAGVTAGLAGDIREAAAAADDLSKRFPTDTLVVNLRVPAIRAAVEISRHEPSRAIELLQPAAPFDLADYSFAKYLRGLAYLAMRQGKEAGVEFQGLLESRWACLQSQACALAHLQLARAKVLTADNAGARTAYQDFFALWKDADPDIPILKEAKAEYAKLQ